ncbi:MAG: hypothetical protein ABSF98_13755 [Bryobacteraceae bacterium]
MITDYLTNGGRIEVARRMVGHSNAKTTGLYDRRNDDISVAGNLRGFGMVNAIHCAGMQVKSVPAMYVGLLVIASLLSTGSATGAQKGPPALTPPPQPAAGKALVIVYRHGGSRGGEGYPIIFVNRNFLAKLRYATYTALEVPQGPVVLDATFEQVDRGTTGPKDQLGFLPTSYFPFTSLSFDSGCAGLDWWRLGKAQSADVARCEGQLREVSAVLGVAVPELQREIQSRYHIHIINARLTPADELQLVIAWLATHNAVEAPVSERYLAAHPDLKERLRMCGSLFRVERLFEGLGACQVAVNQAAATLNPKGRRIELEAEAGRTYYVKYDVPTFRESTMALVDAATGAKEISRLHATTD